MIWCVMSYLGSLIYVPFLLLFGAFIFGGVLARRGEKTWRSMMMLVGSVVQGAGVLGYIIGIVVVMSTFGSGSMGGTMNVWMVVMSVAGLSIFGGMIVFTIGFVAYCGRSGSVAKRAGELEVMLGHLQQRLAELER